MFYSAAFATSEIQKAAFRNPRSMNVQSFALSDNLNFAGLKKLLQQVVEQCDLLRYTFSDDGKWCFIHEALPFHIEEVNLEHGTKNLHSLINDEYSHCFDLKNGPCYRLKFVKVSPRKSILLLSCHPILSEDQVFSGVINQIDDLLEKPLLNMSESKMSKVWSEVLKIPGLGVEDNFFELGGHSLLAVELAEKLRVEFKKDFQVRDIFEFPTIQSLCERSEALACTGPGKKLNTCQWNRTQGELSFNQRQVWYVEALFPNTKMHNLSTSLQIKWDIRPELLEKTLHFLFERHEALRTVMAYEGSLPIQKVLPIQHPEFNQTLEVIDANEGNVRDLMRQETSRSFDLTAAPLFKAKLYRLGERDFVFFIMVHHFIWDGWCFDIFFEELNIIYSAFERGERPVFEKNPGMTYLDYSLWQLAREKEGVFHSQKEYWKEKLKHPLPVLELPLDYPRPKTPVHDGGNFRFSFTAQEIMDLKSFAATNNVSLFHVLLTAFKMTLSYETGLSDIIVGSPIRGRNESELQQTIGYFVNTVALRSQIDLSKSFNENLKAVSSTCLEAFSHQDVPFEALLKEIPYQKDLRRTAIFQTYFTFQDMTNRQFFINGRSVKQVSVNNASVKTDLDMWVKVTLSSIEGAIEYRSDLFKEVSIKKFYETYHFVIQQLGTIRENEVIDFKKSTRFARPKSWYQAYLHRCRQNLWARFKDDAVSAPEWHSETSSP